MRGKRDAAPASPAVGVPEVVADLVTPLDEDHQDDNAERLRLLADWRSGSCAGHATCTRARVA